MLVVVRCMSADPYLRSSCKSEAKGGAVRGACHCCTCSSYYSCYIDMRCYCSAVVTVIVTRTFATHYVARSGRPPCTPLLLSQYNAHITPHAT